MRKIMERKKITSRSPINKKGASHVTLPTYATKRSENLIERLAIPEKIVPHKETITEQDAEFLNLFGIPRSEKRLDKDQYVNDQIEAEKLKDTAGCINDILARKQIIYDQEGIVPFFLEEINKIKNTTLHYAFMEKFYIPHVQRNNSLVALLQSNEVMEKRLQWLEHKFLEAQAKLLECGEHWLFHLKAQYMLFRLSPYAWRSKHLQDRDDTFMQEQDSCDDNLFVFPQIMLLPSGDLDSLINFYRTEAKRTPAVELYFKAPEELVEPMKIFELRCQMKNKNTMYMEKKLNEQKGMLQNLQDKTEYVSTALSNELCFVEQKLSARRLERKEMEKQARELMESMFDKCARKASRIEAVVAVDSLVEAVLHCQSARRACDVSNLLESRLQNLLDAVFHSMKPADEPQLQLEKEWIKKERRELKSAKEAHHGVIRMKKLERKLKIALAPPYNKVSLPVVRFQVRKKKAKSEVEMKPSPLSMEKPYCFESDVDMKLVSKQYQPSSSLMELTKREDPLLKSWEAVEDFGPATVDTPVEEIVRPRKSTESILDLLESRSSYDFILSTISISVGSAEKRDSIFYESDDNTSSGSEEKAAFTPIAVYSVGNMRLLIHSAKQVVTITSTRNAFLIGDAMRSVEMIDDAGGTSIVVNSEGKIEAIGKDSEIRETYDGASFENTLDASGMCILPGFIDAHTHPIWSGDRVNEFAMKLAGATYLDIHNSGGGIFFTVAKTRQATDDELYMQLVKHLTAMMQAGTTTVECKSGYGLDTESEVRLLRIIERAKRDLAVEISSTYCGAHAVPRGLTSAEATSKVINEQIPELKQLIASKELSVENIDVFCEQGVFDTEQSRSILEAGKNIGLKINFHGDELHPTNSAEMGAAVGATAISHLEEISDAGIAAMAANQCVAVILPTTAYVMHLKAPPVRKMIEAGVPVALGTDFNPNAYCFAMPVVMNLACVTLGLSMPEALIAATLNAAAALGRAHTHGSIQVGKMADFVLLKAPRWEHIIYQLGAHHHIIKYVIKEGKIIHHN